MAGEQTVIVDGTHRLEILTTIEGTGKADITGMHARGFLRP